MSIFSLSLNRNIFGHSAVSTHGSRIETGLKVKIEETIYGIG